MEEGCYLDGSRGIYIPYHIVCFAIDLGFNPSIEWKQCIKEAKEKGEDEEDYLTHNYISIHTPVKGVTSSGTNGLAAI